jgi:predicted nucleic acid-binding protein
MKDKFVLDSNIWIEIHRGNTKIRKYVGPFIENNHVCLVDVITTEILRGAKARKDFETLKVAFSDFPQISTSWARVSELGFRVARQGFSPPLIDLYIAQSVQETNRTLVTLDKHFVQIANINHLSVDFLRT